MSRVDEGVMRGCKTGFTSGGDVTGFVLDLVRGISLSRCGLLCEVAGLQRIFCRGSGGEPGGLGGGPGGSGGGPGGSGGGPGGSSGGPVAASDR